MRFALLLSLLRKSNSLPPFGVFSTKQLFASTRVRASPRDASDLRQEMLDMKDIDEIHTSADGGDSFVDKAKEEENTLKKLMLLHSHAKVRLAQLTPGEKTVVEADALAAGRGEDVDTGAGRGGA